MRTHHAVDWYGDVHPKSILFAFAIVSCFYCIAFLLTLADRIDVPSLVQPAFATSAIPPVRVDATGVHRPEESMEDARLTVDQWSCRPGC